jgi:hypothetical protein
MIANRDPGLRLVLSEIDSEKRAVMTEHQLNLLAARIFATGGGRDFLDYLKTITINRVCGPFASNEELRHLEGARWLVGVIQQRLRAGQKQGAVRHEPESSLDPGPAA